MNNFRSRKNIKMLQKVRSVFIKQVTNKQKVIEVDAGLQEKQTVSSSFPYECKTDDFSIVEWMISRQLIARER